MNEKYDHKEIEKKWQKVWKENNLYKTEDDGAASAAPFAQGYGEPKKASAGQSKNFYALVEFPYPSGNLHIGHWYAFAVPDIFVRMKRMQGYNVMFPIGFDAFGLPAENAAIKNGVDPHKWTYENIAYMEKQLQSMGNSFDWSRKVVTADPQYYKWTQWLFLKLYEKGLAYKKKAAVNWCPSCNTVLANEQAAGGKCERCGTEVVQKDLEQWFFKITDYAERLLSDLANLKWPEEIKTAQKNWIGKSSGATFKFQIQSTKSQTNSKSEIQNSKQEIEVFTTRADTLFGVTYLVVAPEYPWLMQEISNSKSQITNKSEIQNYINQTRQKTEIERTDAKKEKTGVEIKGVKAVNPATGKEVPVFVADYVLGNYGTGAVMAVPAHDDRDFEFAKKYELPIKVVIKPIVNSAESTNRPASEISDEKIISEIIETGGFTGEGTLINSEKLNYLKSEEAREKITEKFGEKVTKYKLRDWLLSRQRYWGCPIPVVYDPEGRAHPIPEEHLPWLLPQDVKDFAPKGQSPIATSKELKERVEKIFGKGWQPECDTMDTFVDSSWYFNRYADPHNEKKPFDKLRARKWMPVSRYSGGAEHTNMHLLYSRFFHKALFDLGLVNEAEPFKERMNRGLILGPDGAKMSKSKGNVVDPDEQVERVGSDTVKMYLAFIGPYNETGQYPWDLGGVAGIRRFLERVWRLQLLVAKRETLVEKKEPATSDSRLETLLHQTIKKVTEDIENYKFNTAISSLMILLNELEKITPHEKSQGEPLTHEIFEIFLKLLAPFAPHMTEEIWESLGHKESIHSQKWPEYDETKIVETETTITIQINGKMRALLKIKKDSDQGSVETAAKNLPEIQKWLAEQPIKKVIFVPNKILNFVV